MIGSYLEAYIHKGGDGLEKTLDYLGFKNDIIMKFSYIGGKIIERIINEERIENSRVLSSLYYYLKERARTGEYQIVEYFEDQERREVPYIEYISKIYYALKGIVHIHNIRRLNIKITNGNISLSRKLIPFNEDLVTLINAGIIRLDGVSLQKLNSNDSFDIGEASSGEQCVIITMLGISSIIKDNSLILIDEPEVCLHPEWQEKYILLLTNIFKSYKECQFIIATHSPQIVSNLLPDRCFVLTMEDGLVRNANEYINKSSDYQLATLFDAPGFKNEYLSRISIALFSKISIEKKFDGDDIKTLASLSDILHKISENDPLHSLINALIKARGIYGGY
ncbi:hypothetical protein C9426_28520 [Serratia sp. S1B]|nr:hypothetical protein C9426_28520 [Serratia sp. S1B]